MNGEFIEQMRRLGVEIVDRATDVFEDVKKAATREEAIEEDRQYDILLVGGWVNVCQDADGNLLSPVMFRDPLDPTNVVSDEAAYFIARRRLD